MKSLIKVSTFICSLIILTACDNSSNLSNTSYEYTKKESNKILMKKDIPYKINRGDKINKLSDDTKILIDSDLVNNKTTATLKSGKAEIIRSN